MPLQGYPGVQERSDASRVNCGTPASAVDCATIGRHCDLLVEVRCRLEPTDTRVANDGSGPPAARPEDKPARSAAYPEANRACTGWLRHPVPRPRTKPSKPLFEHRRPGRGG